MLRQEEQEKGVTLDSLHEVYSRFIYPKELLKSLGRRGNPEEVYAIYDSLYKFSLQKLNQFTTDPSLNRLFSYYYEKEGKQRIETSSTLKKYRAAYQEAARNLLTIN